MTDAPCARPGCGAPRAWHEDTVSLPELHETDSWAPNHAHAQINSRPWNLPSGACIGIGCDCTAYLAPEPPQPERTAYVVELSAAELASITWVRTHPAGGYSDRAVAALAVSRAVPIADYMASHPQPAPRMCVCGGDADDHNPVTGRCGHEAKAWSELSHGLVFSRCECTSFREEASS